MSEGNGKLFQRIASVMADVRSLPEDGFNQHDRYKYTRWQTAVEHIGKSMAKHGVVIVPVIVHEVVEPFDNDKAYCSTVEIDFNICDTDGDAFVSRWIGRGINYRTPDKALKTALTNANTTFLLKLFQVGAGDDDPETDGNQPAQPAQRTTKAATPPATKSAAAKKPTKDFIDFQNTLKGIFDKEVVEAAHWYMETWSTANTPDNVRESSKKFTDDELKAMTQEIAKNAEAYQQQYADHLQETFEKEEG